MRTILKTFTAGFVSLIQVLSLSGQNLPLVAGTTFEPNTALTDKTVFPLTQVQQYGLLQGRLSTAFPFNTGQSDEFLDVSEYVITNNAANISNVFRDTADYVFAVKPDSLSEYNILQYRVRNLKNSSAAYVKVRIRSLVRPDLINDPESGMSCAAGTKGFFNLIINTAAEGSFLFRNYRFNLGKDTVVTIPCQVTALGELTVSISAPAGRGKCYTLGVSSIEVFAPVRYKMEARDETVCAGDVIRLQRLPAVKGIINWEVKTGNTWTEAGTSENLSFLTENPGTYPFRYHITPEGSDTSLVSDTINIEARNCCEGPTGARSSMSVLFRDDFGTLDLSDPTGKTYKVWDYMTDPARPVQVTKTTSTPFRWPLNPAPVGAVFKMSGPVIDGEYTVASWLTSYNPYDGLSGARLDWANNITGSMISPGIAFDHSGKPEGGVLLLNVPLNSMGSVIYKRDFQNLCVNNGRRVFFETFIAVFTSEVNGVDISARLTGGAVPVTINSIACSYRGLCPSKGKWVRIAGEVELTGNSFTLELINNAPNAWNMMGNDLALDDIIIRTCSAPDPNLSFEPGIYSDVKQGCKNIQLSALSFENLSKYFDGNAQYLFQWTSNPADMRSWKNISGVRSVPEIVIADPAALNPTLIAGNKIYFRVITATPSIFASYGNFTGAFTANIHDGCRNYSVSEPVELTLQSEEGCSVTGMAEKENAQKQLLFPNPASSRISFSDEVESYSISGTLSGAISGQNTGSSDISRLPQGLYFVRLKLKNGNEVNTRFIKQ